MQKHQESPHYLSTWISAVDTLKARLLELQLMLNGIAYVRDGNAIVYESTSAAYQIVHTLQIERELIGLIPSEFSFKDGAAEVLEWLHTDRTKKDFKLVSGAVIKGDWDL